MRRILPHLTATIIVMCGSYLLALYAHDLSQMSLRAFGTRGQTILGAPTIWFASRFPQVKSLALLLPGLMFLSWQRGWVADTTYVLWLATWSFLILTWTISVAYFSFQPGILG